MNPFLAARLHRGLVVVVAVLTTALLGGLALARGPALEQTARVAVACSKTGLVRNRSAAPSEVYVVSSGEARVASRSALVPRRKRCAGGTHLRGLSRRVAVAQPPGQGEAAPNADSAGAPPGDSTLVVTSRSPVAVAPPPAPADTTPPQTSISNGPPPKTTSTAARFVFSSDELGSSFECDLDNAGWGICTSPEAYSELGVGPHQLSVRAIDTAENVDATPAVRTWTVEELVGPPPPPDTTPPQTSISGGPAATTTSISATLTFSSSEADSSFECNLDNAGWGICTSPSAYSGFALGPHQFSVRAIDAALNADPTPATRSWTVEQALPPPPPPPPAECSSVVASVAAAETAVAGAVAGSVVCLADGSYGEVSLSASKSAEVTLQAEHPGRTTIDGASLDGSHLTLARFEITNEVTVQPGSAAIAIEYNRISGGYMGINAGPTTSTSISDTTIRGNQLVGPFGEDALRINRYHDSADPDPYGILIEANEITGVRENGNHSDCLQSVWGGDGLYFRRNYLHDNRCQGFFVKDQPEAIVGIGVEDNLFLRDNEPCAPEAAGCGQPSYFQVFGPYQDFTMRRNTIWQGEVVATFQEGAGSGTSIESNVADRFWTNTNLSGIAYADNTRCKRETAEGGSWPSSTPGETVDCAPSFNDPAADDFRLLGSDRGVDWAPAEQHYGP